MCQVSKIEQDFISALDGLVFEQFNEKGDSVCCGFIDRSLMPDGAA